jgi:hypothetical protein
MNRRKFIKISAVTLGTTMMGGGAYYIMFKDSDPLSPFYDATRKVYQKRFGDDIATTLVNETKQAYEDILPEVPYIGGKKNIFSEWLNYGAYYLGLSQALSAHGHPIDEIGRIVFDTYEAMADYPKWFLRNVGHLKYGSKYKDQLRKAAAVSQERKYPADFVSHFIDGTDKEFDYGLDVTECGICKLYTSHGADKLSRYMCLSDYVVSKAFGRGLVRYKTIAEGADKCDFRFKKGRETFVYPLRDGWPPQFIDSSTDMQ